MKRLVILGLAAVMVVLLVLVWLSQQSREITILVHMIDNQDRWFREKLKEFEEDKKVTLKVVSFDLMTEVESWLERERETGSKTIGLVKIQKQMLATLAEEGLVMPLILREGTESPGKQGSDVLCKEGFSGTLLAQLGLAVSCSQIASDMTEYLPAALEVADLSELEKDHSLLAKQYYIPRKLEANTLLYRRSKVEEAVQNWTRFKPQIDQMFKEHNRYGLPSDYQLEADPNHWDWYDVAVASFYWAHTEYGGRRLPRTAHRGRRYGGTMTEIAAKIFQAGGDSKALLFEGQENLEAVYDAFEWEAFYRKNGLYNPAMWERRWTGSHIWKAFSQEAVFLAFMHQLDAFFVHGNPASGLNGYLEEPEDMATAIMPKGVSLALNSRGRYVREGRHHSLRTGWWWGIPHTAPDPELSYELARYITSKEFHLEEATRFGMLPIREDVDSEVKTWNADPERRWMDDVFDTARRQFEVGVEELPALATWPKIESVWLDAWFEIVVQENYSPQGPSGRVSRDHIRSVLDRHGRKIKKLAKN